MRNKQAEHHEDVLLNMVASKQATKGADVTKQASGLKDQQATNSQRENKQ